MKSNLHVAPRLRETSLGQDRQGGGVGAKGAGESSAELDRRKAVVHVHPTAANCCRNLVPDVPPGIMEYGTDTTRAILGVMFSGTAARFPDIRFIWSHAGGSAPFLAGRIDGASANANSILDQNAMFDFYHGGGLDLTCLGMAECDEHGNVNTSKFGGRLNGCGGFIDISQNSRAVVFAGTFTAGGLDVQIAYGKLKIMQEGRARKFVKNVEQITFSGKYASQKSQPVIYVTERCVFQLTPGGLELIEVAPGIKDHAKMQRFAEEVIRARTD